uniref:Uncharacterized protein n=1 Tax=Timema poppense TaxID=170557 RepID=A0A7R9CGU2_TIMPO|nr:unnamed protein product [Timema poppensis]
MGEGGGREKEVQEQPQGWYENLKETTIKQQDVKEPPPRVDPPVDPVNGVVQPPVLPAPDRPGRVTNQLAFSRKMCSRFYGNINLLGLSTNLLTPRNLIFRYGNFVCTPSPSTIILYLLPRLTLLGLYPTSHRDSGCQDSILDPTVTRCRNSILPPTATCIAGILSYLPL